MNLKEKFITALAVLGLFDSIYLFIHYVTEAPLPCTVTQGCETIRLSTYASFVGLPTPLYGIVFYFVLGAMMVWVDTIMPEPRTMPWYIRGWTLIGFIVSAFLTGIEAFVLHAWCFWCVVSAVIATLAFIIAWLPTRQRSD